MAGDPSRATTLSIANPKLSKTPSILPDAADLVAATIPPTLEILKNHDKYTPKS